MEREDDGPAGGLTRWLRSRRADTRADSIETLLPRFDANAPGSGPRRRARQALLTLLRPHVAALIH